RTRWSGSTCDSLLWIECARPTHNPRVQVGLSVSSGQPTVYLMAGLPGSGKATYARRLEARGIVRVSVDAEMLARHGRIAVDYPVESHVALLGPVLEWATDRLV